MALSAITRPFHKLSIGCASALLLLTASTVTKVQADNWGREVSFTFALNIQDCGQDSSSGNSQGGNSDSDFNFSSSNWGCSSNSGHDGFNDWGWGEDRHLDELVALILRDLERDHHHGGHDAGGSGSGDGGSGWNWGGSSSGGDPTSGNGCTGGTGDPGNGDPSGTGTPATPEPSVKYLSFIAASAMALLLFGRSRRQRA